MAAEQPQVEQAPISAPAPELGPVPTVKGRPKGRMLLGYIVWGSIGAVIAVIELLAAIRLRLRRRGRRCRRPSAGFSDDHSWVGIFVLGGIVVLAMRILFYPWPYKEPDE